MDKAESVGRVYVFDSADIPASDLRVRHTPKIRPLEDECANFYDEAFLACRNRAIKKIREWNEKKRPEEVEMFDGTLFSFDWLDTTSAGSRVLSLSDVKFTTYKGLVDRINMGQGELRHSLTRTVPMIGIAETLDGLLVLGHRKTPHMGGRYLFPAGFADHPENRQVDEDFFTMVTIDEFSEEIGVRIKPQDVRYVGLTSGDDSKNITIVTYAKLPVSAKDVESSFMENNRRLLMEKGKIEHEHLLYLPNDLEQVTKFLLGRYTGVLNEYAGLCFENGVCTKGPEEVNGEPFRGRGYLQIGNGISAILALMKGRLSDSRYNDLVSAVEESGVVESVEHLTIGYKLQLAA